jgi:hypothetical protein
VPELRLIRLMLRGVYCRAGRLAADCPSADIAVCSSIAFHRASSLNADKELKLDHITAIKSSDSTASHQGMSSTSLAGIAHRALLAEQSRLFEGTYCAQHTCRSLDWSYAAPPCPVQYIY